jgi:taurine dioxygenase
MSLVMNSIARTITAVPLASAIGAEVHGVDLSKPLDDATIAELRRLWLTHLVLFFREQTIDSAQYYAFAKRFGAPMEYPFLKGLDGYPHITQVIKRENEKINFGGVWHSDTTYLERPPMATFLLAREVPPVGGDTMFANMYQAYETLSDGMKKMLDGMVAIATSAKAEVSNTREDRIKDSGRGKVDDMSAEHPVVRTHPETGRKALYINSAHTLCFKGMTEKESAPLLNFLYEHQVKQEATCRFRWRQGSLALWDNRCTQHYPVNDYHGHLRIMHRITLEGDRPF